MHLGISFDVSPDGRWVAFNAERAGVRGLFLQDLRQRTGRMIEGTEDAARPFFSADSRYIGFGSANTLKRVAVILEAPAIGNVQFRSDSPHFDVMPDGEHFMVLLTPKDVTRGHLGAVVNWVDALSKQ